VVSLRCGAYDPTSYVEAARPDAAYAAYDQCTTSGGLYDDEYGCVYPGQPTYNIVIARPTYVVAGRSYRGGAVQVAPFYSLLQPLSLKYEYPGFTLLLSHANCTTYIVAIATTGAAAVPPAVVLQAVVLPAAPAVPLPAALPSMGRKPVALQPVALPRVPEEVDLEEEKAEAVEAVEAGAEAKAQRSVRAAKIESEGEEREERERGCRHVTATALQHTHTHGSINVKNERNSTLARN
jgi:hypothetical protein